jgi:hypothetical protein
LSHGDFWDRENAVSYTMNLSLFVSAEALADLSKL